MNPSVVAKVIDRGSPGRDSRLRVSYRRSQSGGGSNWGDAPAPKTPRFRLGREVTLLIQDDMSRLLDLERGRFYALDPTGTRLLSLALEAGSDEAVRRVAGEAGVEVEIVRDDWDALLGQLRSRRLIVDAGPPPSHIIPGRLGLLLLLALAWVSLRVFGWARTVRLWRIGRVDRAGPWVEGLAPTVVGLDEAVRTAAASHILNTQCKERAVVAWHLLRNRWGLPAELVVGILAFPFQAHAWVECGPMVVTDDPSRCALYTPARRYE